MTELSQVTQLLRDLFSSQLLAVISTQDKGQPYSNLVAFAETDDLKQLLFVTNRNSRKYNNIKADKRATMLIDSRTNELSDFQNAAAVTAIGVADELLMQDRNILSPVFLRKHPNLADFIDRPDNALISLKIGDYIIATFGEVNAVHIQD